MKRLLVVVVLSLLVVGCDVERPSDALPANWGKVDARETRQAKDAVVATEPTVDTCPGLVARCGDLGVKSWDHCTCNEPTPVAVVHTVGAGETLSGIARTYGVRATAIAAANGIQDLNIISIGQVLVIP